MTFFQFLTIIISVTATIAVVLTLIQLLRQTKLIAESLRDCNYERMVTQWMRINEIFVAHPHLRPYFYSGKKVDTVIEDEMNILKCISEGLLNIFETVILYTKEFPKVEPKYQWFAYMDYILDNSPVLRKYLNEKKDWFIQELHEKLSDRT